MLETLSETLLDELSGVLLGALLEVLSDDVVKILLDATFEVLLDAIFEVLLDEILETPLELLDSGRTDEGRVEQVPYRGRQPATGSQYVADLPQYPLLAETSQPCMSLVKLAIAIQGKCMQLTLNSSSQAHK